MLSPALKDFYLKSKTYLLFSLTQMVLTLSIVGYAVQDIKNRCEEGWVISAELLVALLMFLDLMIYGLAHGFRPTKLGLVEWAVFVSFLATHSFLALRGNSRLEEELELALMACRVGLQGLRLSVWALRAREIRKRREAMHTIDLCGTVVEPDDRI